jgi:membrane protein DedA with SNARE-associated domain
MDQALFLFGRLGRSGGIVSRIAEKPAFARALGYIAQRPVLFALSFRFIFGLRAAGPVALGVTRLSASAFALLNLVGAAIWAGVFAAIGFFSTGALFGRHAHLRNPAAWLIAVGVVLGAAALILLVLKRRSWRSRRTAAGEPGSLEATPSNDSTA